MTRERAVECAQEMEDALVYLERDCELKNRRTMDNRILCSLCKAVYLLLSDKIKKSPKKKETVNYFSTTNPDWGISHLDNIVAVDFDGTLCTCKWPGIGEPNYHLIDELIHRKQIGEKIILWTCRNGENLEEAVKWCENLGLTFDAVNENLPEAIDAFEGDTRKIVAHTYIDDKALNRSAKNDIQEFRNWLKEN